MPDYRVVRQGVLLGTLTRTGGDMPWHLGTFAAAAGYETVRSLFDRELQLLEVDEDMDTWEHVWDELAEGMVLEPFDGGEPIQEFLLHIESETGEASWRV